MIVYNKSSVITPSDTTPIVAGGLTAAIYVGGAGVVVVVFQNDSLCAFTCVAGQILPVGAKRVNATGTTASFLVALFQI